ncbi:hypothetical protein HNY73_002979 [Argiope bruennichi]|uniref:Uncharacterized protein n=1 Tax=Argiope bruennichi TaxID=94029 RepID=A0A8T0FZV0_ARGBR|nr:hypothetical protein HNY73_002979 [Argiope bruennichi]
MEKREKRKRWSRGRKGRGGGERKGEAAQNTLTSEKKRGSEEERGCEEKTKDWNSEEKSQLDAPMIHGGEGSHEIHERASVHMPLAKKRVRERLLAYEGCIEMRERDFVGGKQSNNMESNVRWQSLLHFDFDAFEIILIDMLVPL